MKNFNKLFHSFEDYKIYLKVYKGIFNLVEINLEIINDEIFLNGGKNLSIKCSENTFINIQMVKKREKDCTSCKKYTICQNLIDVNKDNIIYLTECEKIKNIYAKQYLKNFTKENKK